MSHGAGAVAPPNPRPWLTFVLPILSPHAGLWAQEYSQHMDHGYILFYERTGTGGGAGGGTSGGPGAP